MLVGGATFALPSPQITLHTDALSDPRAHLLVNKELQLMWRGSVLWRRIVRVVMVAAPKPLYAAIALLAPAQWTNNMRAVHRRISNPNFGLLVGKSFREAGFDVYQNRLALVPVLWFFVPRSLRERIPRARLWRAVWHVEVYTLYVAADGEITLYGSFVEFTPPREHPARPQLGAEYVWCRAGLQEKFVEYLTGGTEPPAEHRKVYNRACWRGVMGAVFAPILFPLLVRIAIKRRHKNGLRAQC